MNPINPMNQIDQITRIMTNEDVTPIAFLDFSRVVFLPNNQMNQTNQINQKLFSPFPRALQFLACPAFLTFLASFGHQPNCRSLLPRLVNL
jgi:hypothetical protein